MVTWVIGSTEAEEESWGCSQRRCADSFILTLLTVVRHHSANRVRAPLGRNHSTAGIVSGLRGILRGMENVP